MKYHVDNFNKPKIIVSKKESHKILGSNSYKSSKINNNDSLDAQPKESTIKFNIKEIDNQLSWSQRTVSILMRSKFFDDIIEIIGKYLLNPIMIIFTSTFAIFFMTLMIIVINNGIYRPFGGELLIAMFFGWIAGVVATFISKIRPSL